MQKLLNIFGLREGLEYFHQIGPQNGVDSGQDQNQPIFFCQNGLLKTNSPSSLIYF